MEQINVSTIVIGFAISALGYFIKATMTRIDKVENKLNDHTTSIEVLKSNHTTLEKKLDELMTAVKNISTDVKNISVELAKKKDID